MFCTRCGLMVEEGNRFCKNCGQEVVAPVATVPGAVNLPPAPVGVQTSVSTPRRYAEFWPRAAAYLIDGVILGIPFGLVALVLIFFLGGFGVMLRSRTVDPGAAAAFVAPIFLSFLFGMIFFVGLQWLYFAGMESSERQATFGKSVMSLRVVNLEGQRLSFGHATGRFFAKIISGMIPLGIGYIMAAFTEKRQALHDMIAGTLVLRKQG
jgi:uncharacterized RDD family membrane protein YckC